MACVVCNQEKRVFSITLNCNEWNYLMKICLKVVEDGIIKGMYKLKSHEKKAIRKQVLIGLWVLCHFRESGSRCRNFSLTNFGCKLWYLGAITSSMNCVAKGLDAVVVYAFIPEEEARQVICRVLLGWLKVQLLHLLIILNCSQIQNSSFIKGT